MFTEDAMMMTPDHPSVNGREAIVKGMGEMAMDVRFTTTEVEVGGDWAWEGGIYTYHGADGTELDRGKYITIWKMSDGGWLIHRDIYNSDNAPMPMEEMEDENGKDEEEDD